MASASFQRTEELDFYNTASALALREEGADAQANDFLSASSNSVLTPQMNFYLGSYYFSKGKFADAATAFEKSTNDNLTNGQIARKNFEGRLQLFYPAKLCSS